MVWFEELQNRKKISKIFYRYEKTFPEQERRSKDQFLDLAENPDAFVYSINHEDENIGYCVIWELQEFYFLEHFEVFEEFRNQKFGEKILESLQEKFENLNGEINLKKIDDKFEKFISDFEKTTTLGKCPECKKSEVHERDKTFSCSNVACDFTIWKNGIGQFFNNFNIRIRWQVHHVIS